MSTAILGIATFVLQARVAKNAEAAQKDLEQARVEQERGRERAVVQLERMRSRMGDVYRPVHAMLLQTDTCAIYMQCEQPATRVHATTRTSSYDRTWYLI
jgi:hypothetical protein